MTVGEENPRGMTGGNQQAHEPQAGSPAHGNRSGQDLSEYLPAAPLAP